MINITNRYECCGCGACKNICPTQCISMQRDAEGFLYPKVDTSKCIGCGKCETVCIYGKKQSLRPNDLTCYAVKANDDGLRKQSSSGGVFSLIANLFLKSNGAVYGVKMDDGNKSCSFSRVTDENELYKLMGSKYIQADTNDVYRQVEADLKSGKKVLFSGVPCQISALHFFLNRQYENLFCVEVICHGTPSPLVWEKYAGSLEKKYKTEIASVNFRNKKHGWKNYSLEIAGKDFIQNKIHSSDPYLIAFLKDYTLRPSCYNCKAKTIQSMADLTIADYWGVHEILPDMDDDKGTSLVIINTDNGKAVFEQIKEFATCFETPFDFAVSKNLSYSASPQVPKKREEFFSDINTLPFDIVAKKYGSVPLLKRIKRKISSLKRKTL